jgi:hypothetical protein
LYFWSRCFYSKLFLGIFYILPHVIFLFNYEPLLNLFFNVRILIDLFKFLYSLI